MRIVLAGILALLVACASQSTVPGRLIQPTDHSGTLHVVLAADQSVHLNIDYVLLDETVVTDSPLGLDLNSAVLLGSIQTPAQHFQTITLKIKHVVVNGTSMLLPTSTVKLAFPADVIAKKEQAIVLYLQVDESSYHKNLDIFAPVFKIYTVQDARVQVEPSREVHVWGQTGQIVKISMNERGETGVGLAFPKTSQIELVNGALQVVSVPLPREAPVNTTRKPTQRMTAVDYRISPLQLRVKKGEEVVLEITSLDHVYGMFIDGYDLHHVIVPHQQNILSFVADKQGTFQFYCQNPCGPREGKLWGKLIVTP